MVVRVLVVYPHDCVADGAVAASALCHEDVVLQIASLDKDQNLKYGFC